MLSNFCIALIYSFILWLQIVNCDNFTRVFLNRLGINVPDPIPWPDALEVRMFFLFLITIVLNEAIT